MSNALAIATVTAALAQIVRTAVQSTVPGSDVLTERPVAEPPEGPRVRLFLYQCTPNPALRNRDLPTRTADGTATQRPAAALDLHYLLVFYGDESKLEPQRMLGAVVRDIHAKPVLTRQMIRDAVASQDFLEGSNLADSYEQVKFTPLLLSMEELSKLWSVFFQAPYALSVAYQATVVLIESEEGASAPLPVLRRGERDEGVEAVLGPFPRLDAILVGALADAGVRPRPFSYPGAQLGTVLTVRGKNLGGANVSVRFHQPRLDLSKTVEVGLQDRSDTELTIPIPDDVAGANDWAAGLYSVAAVVENGGKARISNSLPLSFSPKIAAIAPPNPVSPDLAGNVTLTVTCRPNVRPTQTATLLIVDREVPAQTHPAETDTVVFAIEDAPLVTGGLVRLRVEGIDSFPFRRVDTDPKPHLEFDEAQRVTIQ